ncbi:hypothetical protein OFY05_23575 (plasmid) [Pseudocitrobacter faecalis]|nr:hypothetical protein OFY05_23575 [Pseudocitrobacter faecalis]
MTWASKNTEFATVDQSGVVTGVASPVPQPSKSLPKTEATKRPLSLK